LPKKREAQWRRVATDIGINGIEPFRTSIMWRCHQGVLQRCVKINVTQDEGGNRRNCVLSMAWDIRQDSEISGSCLIIFSTVQLGMVGGVEGAAGLQKDMCFEHSWYGKRCSLGEAYNPGVVAQSSGFSNL
jgi:hypothetical protein